MTATPFPETPGTVASKILMLRAAAKRTILIVEGKHDALVFQNFIDSTRCTTVIAWGKENALGALSLVRKKETEGILCVVDRDFDFVLAAQKTDRDVVYTDCHDLDLMIFKSKALDKVLAELASVEKLEQFRQKGGDIRDYLLSVAAPIGSLRLFSTRAGANLTFDGMSFAFVDNTNLHFTLGELVREVLNRSKRPHSQTDMLVKEIEKVRAAAPDLWDLCVAEDVLQMLARALCKMIGSQKPSKISWRELQTYLRLAYESDFFRLSSLCSNIKKWEAAQPDFACLLV